VSFLSFFVFVFLFSIDSQVSREIVREKKTHTQIEGAETCARPQIQCQTSHPAAAAAAAKEKSTQR
jgi:hypothetical protein